LEAYKGKVADLEREMADERERQRLALQERLARRRKARIKDVEDQASSRETALVDSMQKKSGQAAEELQAVENMLRPVAREAQRMQEIEAAIKEETAPTVKKVSSGAAATTAEAGVGTEAASAEAPTASLDADPEIAALQAETEK
jgi:hypothetical protein